MHSILLAECVISSNKFFSIGFFNVLLDKVGTQLIHVCHYERICLRNASEKLGAANPCVLIKIEENIITYFIDVLLRSFLYTLEKSLESIANHCSAAARTAGSVLLRSCSSRITYSGSSRNAIASNVVRSNRCRILIIPYLISAMATTLTTMPTCTFLLFFISVAIFCAFSSIHCVFASAWPASDTVRASNITFIIFMIPAFHV